MTETIVRIDLRKNALYVVKDGKIESIEAPPTGFGEHTIVWQDGKIDYVKHGHIQKI